MISQRTIDEIMAAANIVDVVSDFVPLKRAGRSWVGTCPFHDDHSPSMHVTPHLGIYKCFVCDAKGNAVNFLMNHEKITYPEALRYLAKKYNIQIEEQVRKLSPEEEAVKNERDRLLSVNSYAEKFFIDQLMNTEEGRAIGLTYLRDKRGFRDETIRKFKLGYCPDSWETFTRAAIADGYKEEDLLTLGLCKKSEKGKVYDFYRGRVILPIHNALGSVIGFGGRVMKKDEHGPKYYNSPENPIYHKSDVLYGFFFAKTAIRTEQNVYLVEGYTDVISMAEAGVQNVVASSGTSLTDGQVRLLQQQTRNITVLYDGDKAGIAASLRGINMLVAAGFNIRAVQLPEGEDPDSFAKAHRDSELKTYLKEHSVTIIQFIFNVLSQDAGNDAQKRFEMTTRLLETIAAEKDPLKQSFFVEECARLTGRPENVLRAELQKMLFQQFRQHERRAQVAPVAAQAGIPAQTSAVPEIRLPFAQPPQPKPTPDQDFYSELNLIRLLLRYGNCQTYVSTCDANGQAAVEHTRVDQYIYNELYKDGLQFQNPVCRKIYEEYAKLLTVNQDFDEMQQAFAHHEDGQIQDIALSILMDDNPECSPGWETRYDLQTNTIDNNIEILNREIAGSLVRFKLRQLEKQKILLYKELEQEHPQETEAAILQRLNAINARTAELSSQINFVISQSSC